MCAVSALFVPERRTAPVAPLEQPGTAYQGPLYRLTVWPPIALLAPPALGVAHAAIDDLLEKARVWQRCTAFHNSRHPENDHTHDQSHDHGDGHVHTHLPPPEGIKLSSLLAMGVSGGLVPCPEALGIMVIANRTLTLFISSQPPWKPLK